MAEPFQVYQRTLKLPCEGLESGRRHKVSLDVKIKKALLSFSAHTSRPKCELEDSETGNLIGSLKTNSYEVSLQTTFGQNTVFVSGTKQTFISYGVRMESTIPTLDRAASSAENLTLALKIAGGILGPAAFFGIVQLFLNLYGHVVIPYLFVAVSLLVGIWCGSKLGGLVGSALERRAFRRVENKGVLSEAEGLWDALVEKLDSAVKEYERV